MSQAAPRPRRLWPEQDFNLDAGSGEHVNERIETEQFDSAAHEVADPRLRHAEEGCRLALGQSFGFDELLQPERQERAQLEGDGFLPGEPKVFEDVAGRWFDQRFRRRVPYSPRRDRSTSRNRDRASWMSPCRVRCERFSKAWRT